MLIDINKVMRKSILTMLALPLVVAACTSEEEILTDRIQAGWS